MARQCKTADLFSSKRWHVVAALTLLAATFLLYSSSLEHGFIFIWDDYKYVVNNPDIRGISPENLKAVFSRYYIGNYAPLHLISYMLDYQLWGLDPAGYHFGNILLHAINGLLVYRLLLKLELPAFPALFGAALFVLHPVQVESVAWVSERKNVLAALFFLLSLLSYIDYREGDTSRVRNYLISLTFFVSALLTKSVAVVFPFIIVCYDYCYYRKTNSLKLADKLPFLLLALATAILAVLSQHKMAGIEISDYPGGTLLGALWTMIPVFLSYLKDLVYPLDLSPYYMVQIRKSADAVVVLAATVLICLGAVAVMSIRRRPQLLFFISIFILSLLPVMQIIPLLATLKNDRYLYFPMIGAAGAAGMLLTVLMQRSTRLRNAAVAVAIAVCAFLGSAAYYQSLIWKDNITLWKSALEQNPDNMLAWLMLAKGYTKLGNSGAAVTAITTYNKLKSKHGPLRGWEGDW